MKIAFLGVNYHSDEDTLSVISQLEKNILPKNTELIIYCVDNSVSQNLKNKIAGFEHAVYLSSPGNIGFTGGVNIGLRQALKDKTDIIVLINNDTIVPSDLVKNILSSKIRDPKVGVVGGLIYFAKGFEFKKHYDSKDLGKVIWYAGGAEDWDNVYSSHVGVDEVDHGQFNKSTETDFVTGCLFVTRRDVLEKVGLMDEKYCLYFEDADLGERIKRAGFKLFIDPQIKIWHKVAQSSAIGSPLNDYFLTRNRLLFGSKYARPRTIFALYREATRKLLSGTPAQKLAVKDFFLKKFGWGSWAKKVKDAVKI